MRWLHIDKFLSLEKGVRARAVKNVTQGEDHLHDHMPGYPMMPASLMIESVAQTGGILAGLSNEFSSDVILAKIDRAHFTGIALPGDQLIIDVEIVEMRDEGCRVSGTITIDGNTIAEVSLMFVHLEGDSEDAAMPEGFVFTDDFRQLLRLSGIEEPGAEDG